MTWKEAAIQVLQDFGDPMHADAILEEIFSRNLKSTTGETPILTLRTEIYRSCIGHENVDRHTSDNIFYEDTNGNFGLYAWIEAENYFQENIINKNPNPISKETNSNNIFIQIPDIIFPSEDDAQFFSEGKEFYVLHLIKERNPNLVSFVKNERYRINSDLPCEVCGVSFRKNYGPHGDKYIEAHHTKAISELTEETIVKPNEIALVCSNCHKMIHRYRPWLSLESLKEILNISK